MWWRQYKCSYVTTCFYAKYELNGILCCQIFWGGKPCWTFSSSRQSFGKLGQTKFKIDVEHFKTVWNVGSRMIWKSNNTNLLLKNIVLLKNMYVTFQWKLCNRKRHREYKFITVATGTRTHINCFPIELLGPLSI